MFQSPESSSLESVSTAEFDRANAVLLQNNQLLPAGQIDYKVYEISLGTAHTNDPLGLSDDGIVANEFTVLSAPNPVTLRINSIHAGAITAIQGWRRKGKITELYVTNSVAGGTLQVEVTWDTQNTLVQDELASMKPYSPTVTTPQPVIPTTTVRVPAQIRARKTESIVPVTERKVTVAPTTSPYVKYGLLATGVGLAAMILKSGDNK